MTQQAADLQRRKAIEVRADAGRLTLDFRVHGRRILGWLNHVRNVDEDESGRIPKGVDLQLPYPVHENVGSAQGGPYQAAGRTIGLHIHRLTHIADEDTRRAATIESAKAGLSRRLTECGFEQVPVQPEEIAGIQSLAAVAAGMKESFSRRGFGEPQSGEKRLTMKLVDVSGHPRRPASRNSSPMALLVLWGSERNLTRSHPRSKVVTAPTWARALSGRPRADGAVSPPGPR